MVKFLSSLNDSELFWSYAQIIFPACFAGQGVLRQDGTMAGWNLMTLQVLQEIICRTQKFDKLGTKESSHKAFFGSYYKTLLRNDLVQRDCVLETVSRIYPSLIFASNTRQKLLYLALLSNIRLGLNTLAA